MNFPEIVIDESVDARIINLLKQNGYMIYSIAEKNHGIPDIEVISIALAKNAFIITEDKDFGDEIVFKKLNHFGTLLLRLHGMNSSAKGFLVLKTIEQYKNELLLSFAVLTEKKLRIRKL